MVIKLTKAVLPILLSTLICGCAAVGVPITFDPNSKLEWAQELIDNQNRPLPAEPLIEEAISIYKKRGDNLGLANAYRTYAIFLKSEAVENWGQYRKWGFMNKTVTFDNRYQKAIEYYEIARDIYEKNSKYDALTNVYLNMGMIYQVKFNDKKKACDCYAKSLESHLKFKKDNPDTKIKLPIGFRSYEDYIAVVKEEAGCP